MGPKMFFLAYHCQKIALLRKEKNLLHIDHLRTLNANVAPTDILKSILRKKDYKLVTGLEAEAVLSRTLTLKLTTKKEILAALPFQVENLLPYSQDELILLPTLYQKKGETEVLLLATSKKTISEHLEMLEPLELDPDIVSCVPLALLRFTRHFFPKYPSIFIHYKDKNKHAFVVVKEERLVASQFHKPQDFERMCTYMQKKYPEIQHILTFGEAPPNSTLTTLEVTNPNLAEYAIPIGLALDAAKDDSQSGQFRQDNHSKKTQKKRKKQLASFGIICVCFIFATLFVGNLHLKKVENTFLEVLGSSKEIRLSKAVENLEYSLYQEKKSVVNLPTIPRVYEVLTWLSTHPTLNEECSITHLTYQVIKSPRLGSKIKTYAAKVELELTTPNSTIARTFHESLLKDRTMIDQKEGVKWNADHGAYRICFHLKSRPLG